MVRTARLTVDEPITFAKAARQLGLKDKEGRKLRQLVLAREESTGNHIALRIRWRGKPSLRITIAMLRREFPGLFRPRDEGSQQAFRRYVETIEERMAAVALATSSGYVDPKLADLRKRVLLDLEQIRDDVELICGIVNEFDARLASFEQHDTAPDRKNKPYTSEGRE